MARARAPRQQLFDDYVARVAEARAQVQQILEDLAVGRTQLDGATESLADLELLAHGYEKTHPSGNSDGITHRHAPAALALPSCEESNRKPSLSHLRVGLELST